METFIILTDFLFAILMMPYPLFFLVVKGRHKCCRDWKFRESLIQIANETYRPEQLDEIGKIQIGRRTAFEAPDGLDRYACFLGQLFLRELHLYPVVFVSGT